ncbi:MAG: DUF1829 domain-containing protein [Negativicutes bacterium]|jgi:hypothetical protein
MFISPAPDYISDYLKWIKQRITQVELPNGWTELNTPFLDRHNDGISIYLRKNGSKIEMTDDSFTLIDLEMSGCNIKTPTRKQLLTTVLNGYGIKLDGQALTVNATEHDFAQKKHMLIQAIMTVNDMFVVARNQVENMFLEDITEYFDEKDIRYLPFVPLHGTSGLLHTVDFVIPKSKKAPERCIFAINNPTTDYAERILFRWLDIKDARQTESKMYALLNDSKTISDKVVSALKAYECVTTKWSEREKIIAELAA